MLDEPPEHSIISLLSQSSEEDDINLPYNIRDKSRTSSSDLRLRLSDVSDTLSTPSESPTWKTCAQRSLEFVLSLDLTFFIDKYCSRNEAALLGKVRSACAEVTGTYRILGMLLSRQWPKWHSLPDEELGDDDAISALESIGVVQTAKSCLKWDENIETHPRLWGEDVLKGLGLRKEHSRSDLLLKSLPPVMLKSLASAHKQTLSRTMMIKRVKAAYDGKQRKIFGGLNDMTSLLKRISDLHAPTLLFLDGACRDLFLRLSFWLDLDAEEKTAWNSALPETLLKSFANKGIGGSLSPRRLSGEQNILIDSELCVFSSADQIETSRSLAYLLSQVELKRLCANKVSANVRSYLESIPHVWDKETFPEWWWRRQLPRRCSNVIWKCIAELERLKHYEIAFDHLSFLIDNNEVLLGRKRRGKVAIRLLIEATHLKIPLEKFNEKLLSLDFFPADRSEILRRLGGFSLSKFDWPCGFFDSRTVVIPGANSRDINWVERAALDEYYLVPHLGGFSQGLHCEGRIMNEIFGVLFKKFLESDHKGVWQSPLQKWAMDIGFIEAGSERWATAEAILKEVESRNYEELVSFFSACDPYDFHPEIPSILSCLTGAVFSGIMRLLLHDPFYWGGGQPDLLAWNISKKTIVFSEVKGPGDHLSPRQRWWLAELKRLGANAEVCHVVDEPKETKGPRGKKLRKISPIDVVELD